jgi:hypothetical protein
LDGVLGQSAPDHGVENSLAPGMKLCKGRMCMSNSLFVITEQQNDFRQKIFHFASPFLGSVVRSCFVSVLLGLTSKEDTCLDGSPVIIKYKYGIRAFSKQWNSKSY